MPNLYKERQRPVTWKDFQPRPLHPYLLPFSYTNWAGEWMAYILGKWSIFEVLDYVGSFSILVAVIFYFADAGDRLKQKHYQAWQVINTAQGKGGSGGRIDALQELNNDGVSLAAVDLTDAQLEEVRLVGADLRRGEFSGADLKNAVLKQSNLEDSVLHFTNLRYSDCRSVNLSRTDFKDADLNGANLGEATVREAVLDRADLRNADLTGLRDWQTIESIRGADVHGVRNPPPDFLGWASAHGALDIAGYDDWQKKLAETPTTLSTTQSATQPADTTTNPSPDPKASR